MAYPWDIHRNEIFIGGEAGKDVMRDVAAGRRTLALIVAVPASAKSAPSG